MTQIVRHQLWIAAAAAIVLLTNLGGPWLWDDDEPRNAACTREMRERGDWIVPTFNHELRTDKPVLLYWLMRTAYAVFGENEFAARFWSAVLAIGTSLATYHLGRLLFRPEIGLWAGLILATTLMFDFAGRAATPDSTLIFCATASLLAFVWGGRREAGGWGLEVGQNEGNLLAIGSPLVPARWQAFVIVYALMGLAVLAKGPIGVLGPCGAIGLYLICIGPSPARERTLWSARWPRAERFVVAPLRKFAANFWPACKRMRLPIAVAVVGAIALPWYIAVGVQTDGAWLAGFLGKHNLSRFTKPMEGHQGPIVYYLPAILAGFFPWSIFLPLAIVQLVRRLSSDHAWRPGYTFAACWAALYIGVFSLSGTKLPSYVLPAYPALALITGAFVEGWIREPAAISRAWIRVGYASLAVVGLALMIGLIKISQAQGLLPGETVLCLVGVIPLAGAAVGFWFVERDRIRQAALGYAVMAVLLCVTIVGFGAGRVNRHQNNAPLVAAAREAASATPHLATFDYPAPSVVFYARDRVHYFNHEDHVRDYFRHGDDRFLIVPANRLAELQELLPAGVGEIERQRRFLRRGDELVLLGPTKSTARSAAGTRLK